MREKTTIWIMSVLFSLGIIAAYHADNKRVNETRVKYQREHAAPYSAELKQMRTGNDAAQVDFRLEAADEI